MLDVPLLLQPHVLLALCVVAVEIVVLCPQLFIFLLGPPEFLLGIADAALVRAVLLSDSLLRQPDLLVGALSLAADLGDLALALVDPLPQLIHLSLQRAPVLQL